MKTKILDKFKDPSNSLIMEYGGFYSIIEKLLRKGTGSMKIIYVSGLQHFDEIKEVNADSNYTNFEELKNGLLIRFIKSQKKSICLFHFYEIKKIELEKYKIFVKRAHWGPYFVFVGNLSIHLESGEKIDFFVSHQNLKSITTFLKREKLIDTFIEYENPDKMEKDNNPIILEIISHFI